MKVNLKYDRKSKKHILNQMYKIYRIMYNIPKIFQKHPHTFEN